MRPPYAADRELWQAVARFIDSTEKEEVLELLALTDPALHVERELVPVAHGDPFVLRELLTELRQAGLVQRLSLHQGDFYSLMPTQGLREKVLRLADYYAGRHR